MRMLNEFFPEFAEILENLDELYIYFSLSKRELREVLSAFSKEV